MNNSNISFSSPLHLRLDALEARFALRVAARLSEASDALPHDFSERLRVAREQAVERARTTRRVAATSSQVVGVARASSSSAALLGGGSPSWWWRFASVLPFVALIGGLLLIQQFQAQEQIDTAAEIDADLLADDLPPAAYSDPGFKEFLNSPAPLTARE